MADVVFSGALFDSFSALSDGIRDYSSKYGIKLGVTDAQHFVNSACDITPSLGLVYKSITWKCLEKIKTSTPCKRRGRPPIKKQVVQEEPGCPFAIHVKLHDISNQLKIVKMSARSEHNHKISLSIHEHAALSSQFSVSNYRNETTPMSGNDQQEALSGNDQQEEKLQIAAGNFTERATEHKDSVTSAETGDVRATDTDYPLEADDSARREKSHIENLLETLLSFQRRSLFCDTVLLTSVGGSVFAHSCVLAAICPSLLSSLNQTPFMVHKPNVIDFTQYDSALIAKLVEFFYTGRLCPLVADRLILILDELGVAFQSPGDTSETRKDIRETLEGNARVDEEEIGESFLQVDEELEQAGAESDRDLQDILGQVPKLVAPVPDNEAVMSTIKRRLERKPSDKLTPGSCSSPKTKRQYVKRKTKGDRESLMKSSKINSEPFNCSANYSSQDVIIPNQFLNQSEKLQRSRLTNESILPERERDCSVDGAIYCCHLCDATFDLKNALNKHTYSHYLIDDGRYQCKVCSKTFKLKDTLIKHIRTHCEQLSGVETAVKPHASKAKRHECQICSHLFITPSRLKAHMNAHTGSKPHMCQTCGNRYNDPNELTKHERRHRGDQRYVCNVCERKFYTSKLRNIHAKTHTGEKPYQCNECGSQFTQLPSLKCHMLLHTGSLPYPCEQCDKSFRRPMSLKIHVLNVHTEHSKRPFVCARCGRGFSLHCVLKHHMRTHDSGTGRKRERKIKPPLSGSGRRSGVGGGVKTLWNVEDGKLVQRVMVGVVVQSEKGGCLFDQNDDDVNDDYDNGDVIDV